MKRAAIVLLLSLGVTLPWLPTKTEAADPRIGDIKPFLTNQGPIHFDTDANRTHILQHTTSLSTRSRWSNMFTGFAFPFPNHYVVVDTKRRGSARSPRR